MCEARETFGQRIRDWRDRLGLSQEWLADRVGMARPHLSKIERGRIGAPLEPLRIALLRALDEAERERGITAPTPDRDRPGATTTRSGACVPPAGADRAGFHASLTVR